MTQRGQVGTVLENTLPIRVGGGRYSVRAGAVEVGGRFDLSVQHVAAASIKVGHERRHRSRGGEYVFGQDSLVVSSSFHVHDVDAVITDQVSCNQINMHCTLGGQVGTRAGTTPTTLPNPTLSDPSPPPCVGRSRRCCDFPFILRIR